ncbi:urea ABC transporter permease subunit UrtB [Microbulbifer agarilyticus]|uniref:Urea ABC transporter permease subunit UrtB n=1 Tax=Microbulbifer agarilyticus TaxID=260552 RepID=A0A1Q2M1X7_9GAMM|nr:urea ABC transporter permease subunit UrtB [Microbulbifer agarilyticus]AQQ66701.1 urea ABC transporter permease subunit UrtB [Microbulbifer agarilyticus]
MNALLHKLWSVAIVLLLLPTGSPLAQSEPAGISADSVLQQLPGASLKKTGELIGQLEQAGGAEMRPLFEVMLAGELYFIKESKQIIAITKTERRTYMGRDVFGGATLGEFTSREIKKIRVNNRLRSQLRETLARIDLLHGRKIAQKQAVLAMLDDLNEQNMRLLTVAQQGGVDGEVARLIDLAAAMVQLRDSRVSEERLEAIGIMTGQLEPAVRNQLQRLVNDAQEQDLAVRAAAQKALDKISERIEFFGQLEQLFFGLSLGSVLLLAAIGLAITFGVMGVINMAHGEMIMLGAYTTYVIQQLFPGAIAYSLLIAVPAAFLVSGSVGVLIERGVIRHLQGRPLETLLATFGISLILQQAVRSIFSPLNMQVVTPNWMSGSLVINPVFSVTYNRLYILLFALAIFAALVVVLKKSSLGLNVRAVSQNRDMAKAMGVRTEMVDAMTFGLGSGIAGVAGVALSQLTNVGPNLGQSYIIDSFMVVVFGGVGNLLGTLVGGFSLGVANKFLEPSMGAVLANIIVLVGLILFIQKRPKGLFPQRGRAAE